MINKKTLSLWLFASAMLIGCEFPGSPDFKTSQKVEAPIMYNKTFQFMGGSNALIDTTSGDMDSLFSINEDNFILITKEQDFDFGDLNDAIPQVNVDPTSFESQVGEISLENFSSDDNSNLGTADFEGLTGMNAASVNTGDPIFGGATPTPVNIDIGANTDYFVSAVVKSGGLEIGVVNSLGFNIDKITVVLNSGNTPVGSTELLNVDHNVRAFERIFFDEGDVLAEINVDVSVEWSNQSMQASPGDLVVENVVGVDLFASEVEAVVDPQEFSTNNITIFDDSEFQFTQNTHFVELESGELHIAPIINSLEIAVESMTISFPGIRHTPYRESDSLVIQYTGPFSIPRNGYSPERNIDLTDHRIYAEDNQIHYNIKALTEDTQTGFGAEPRIIHESNTVSSEVNISNLNVKEAFGVIVTQNISLGEDDFTNGSDILDLFNDQEAQLTEIDGIDDFSNQFDGLEFTAPSLNIRYTTSVGVGTTVYGSFLGIDPKGKQVFMKGLLGSEYEVSAADPIDGLYANGVQLMPDQLIKFDLETSSNKSLVSGTVNFNITNSNVDDFLNNLPNQIRFIGKAVINEANEEGGINTPVQFDPVIEVGLPLAFKTTTAATFTDTSATTIDVPSSENGDKVVISGGKIIVEYINGLPLGINLNLTFLDEFGLEFMRLPEVDDKIELAASAVDELTRFAASPVSGTTAISLNRSQMDMINKTQSIVISAGLETANNDEVKLRTTDSIVLTVKAELTIEAEVKN